MMGSDLHHKYGSHYEQNLKITSNLLCRCDSTRVRDPFGKCTSEVETKLEREEDCTNCRGSREPIRE